MTQLTATLVPRLFEEFHRSERESIFKALALTLRDRDLAADAIDETMVRAARQWQKVKGLGNPTGWAYREGINWAGSKRRRGDQVVGFRLHPVGIEGPEARDPGLARAVSGLPLGQRQVLVLRNYLDWSPQQIAEALGISEAAAEDRAQQSLQQLALIVSSDQPHESGSLPDRLKRQFEYEAGGISVPVGSIDSAVRLGRRRRLRWRLGGGLLLAGVIGGATVSTYALLSDPEPQVVSTTIRSSNTTANPVRTDLSFFDWKEVTLPGLPPGLQGYINNAMIGPEGYTVVGGGYDPSSGTQSSFIATSPDGEDWQLTDISATLGLDISIYGAVVQSDRIIGWGYNGKTGRPIVMNSIDRGKSFSELDLGVELGPSENLNIFSAAIDPKGGLLLVGSKDTQPPVPAFGLDVDGKRLDVDEAEGTLTVTDIASGAVLFSGHSSLAYPDASAAIIYEPETFDVILQIPFDVLSPFLISGNETGTGIPQAVGGVVEPVTTLSGFVQPVPSPAPGLEPATLEIDGFTVAIDERARYQVTDEAGSVVAAGSIEDLYNPPMVLRNEAGDLIIGVPGPQLQRAREQAFSQPEGVYRSELFLAYSADGVSFLAADLGGIGSTRDTYIQNMVYGPTGFLGIINGPSGSGTIRSSDGLNWELGEGISGTSYVNFLAGDQGGYLVISGDAEPRLLFSADGLEWEETDLSQEQGQGYFMQVSVGPLGAAVTGQRSVSSGLLPTGLSRDDRRLIIDPNQGTITLFDELTGEVLFETDFDPVAVQPPAGIERKDGRLTIFGKSGEPLFSFSEDEIADSQDRLLRPEEFGGLPVLYFSSNWREWKEVILAGTPLSNLSLSYVAIGEDVVLVAGQNMEFISTGQPSPPQLLIGRPKG